MGGNVSMIDGHIDEVCKCYHTRGSLFYTYNPITGAPIAHNVTIGVCWGTKEMDECRCGGDRSKCDFYPTKEG